MRNERVKIIIAVAAFSFVALLFVGIGIYMRRSPGPRELNLPPAMPHEYDEVGRSANNEVEGDVVSEGAILFSENAHFYAEDISLALTGNDTDMAEIYYTLDGTLPTMTQRSYTLNDEPFDQISRHYVTGSALGDVGATVYTEAPILYEEPIRLKAAAAGETLNSYTVRAVGKKMDGSFTDVHTHTYFAGADVHERFDSLIFSLSVDPYDLYDFDHGIAVPGRLRDEYITESGDTEPWNSQPANYNERGREFERDVHVELIDASGDLVFTQNAGLRIFGGWSRAMQQKSFFLYPRRIYDPDRGKFHFDFFPEDRTYYQNPIARYDRIVLRNNATDNPYAFLRDEVISDLAAELLPDTQSNRAAAVFLNGEYYGFVWIHQVYDEDYFIDKNEIMEEEGEYFRIFRGNEFSVWTTDDDPLSHQGVEDFSAMYNLHETDLTVEANFEELLSLMDIDSFFAYYAIQLYVNNRDWSWANRKVYRYQGPAQERALDGASTLDGRWRWLLFDTDWSMGLNGARAEDDSLGELLGKVQSDRLKSDLLIAILKRPDMRAQFAALLCDIMNYHYSPERLSAMVEQKESERYNELYHNFLDGGAELNDEVNSWASMDTVGQEIEIIKTFAKDRPGEIRRQMESFMDIAPEGYYVNISGHEQADIILNSITLGADADFRGFYYDMSPVELSASKPPGFIFSHWLINGVEVYEEQIRIGAAEANDEGEIFVELVIKAAADGNPVVTLIDHEGQDDYFILHNPHEQAINLSEFFVTDDVSNPHQQALSLGHVLGAGDSIHVYCDNYNDADLSAPLVGFSLSNGEVLQLMNRQGEVIFSQLLPRINNDYVLRRNMRNGEFYGSKRYE